MQENGFNTGYPQAEAPRRNAAALVLSIISLAAGVFSLVFCWFFGYVGLPFGITGIITGVIGKKKDSASKMAKAGFIMSIIGTILSVVIFILFIVLLVFSFESYVNMDFDLDNFADLYGMYAMMSM